MNTSKTSMRGARRIARLIRHAMTTPDAARNIAHAGTMVRPNTRVSWDTPDEHVELVCRDEDDVMVFRAMASTRWATRPLDLAVCFYGGSWWVRDRVGATEPEIAANAEAAFALAAVLTMDWLDNHVPRHHEFPDIPVAYLSHSLNDYTSMMLFM